MKDGLASNHVYSILQDRKGFMWFGTAHGLQRYDGRKTVMYRSPAGNARYVPGSNINQLLEDTSGLFWIRPDGEVGLFNPETFRYQKVAIHTLREVPPRADYRLFQTSTGAVFLLITRYGILYFDPKSNAFVEDNSRIQLPPDWKPINMTEDPQNGDYWIGCEPGLAIFRPSTREVFYKDHNPHHHPLLSDKQFHQPFTALFIDKQQRCWFTTWPSINEAFYCFDIRSNKLLPFTAGLEDRDNVYGELHRYFQHSKGGIWASGLMVLHEFDSTQHRFQRIRDEHIDDFGIRFEKVWQMIEDREQNIWIATDEGIFIFNPERQFFHTTSYSWFKGAVTSKRLALKCIVEASNGNIYGGSWGWGSFSWDADLNAIPNNIMNSSIADKDRGYYLQWSMYEDSVNHKLWIGCQSGRLIIYDLKTRQSSFYIVPSIDEKTIRQITRDENGNIWLGTQYGHLLKWSADAGYGGGFIKGFHLAANFGTIIIKLLPVNNHLWIGTHNRGLHKFDMSSEKVIRTYHSKLSEGQSLQSDIVNELMQYNDSILFVSTGQLNKLNTRNDSIQIIGAEQGLPSSSIGTLVKDHDGNLWIGLMNGIARYHPIRKSFTLFTQKDGVINGNFECDLLKRNGDVVFGNPHEIVVFNPQNLYIKAPPLEVQITDFKLFNSYLPADSILKLKEVKLEHTQNSITIEFATLSYLQRDKTTYFYMLDGLEKNWIRADLGLYANYSMLPPGNYVFKVMCRNADGIDSPNITTLKIVVQPPFWQSWWFITLLAMLVAALVYMIHRFRLNRVLEMEKVRTRIARDLHDDMGSTLSTINILSEMAKMKVNNDAAKTGEYLNKISDNSSRMMEAMDDIVWSINPSNDSMQRITARMREFATGVLEARNIEFSFRVDDQVQDLKLNMEARRDLFLVFKEAVNNLAKYSYCKNADISLRVIDHTLLLRIEDDGIGFDPNNADSGNGLNNMQKRAQSLKGTLQILSKPGKGTTVLLEVPAT
ncbi:hypothetical protein HHL16_03740 [Pseudoflavitalea sp. G-6-1-2]|uniref:ligand-binding sensor domain-containing protein n=1 Tax=Pseudoflavitalea sp. G-6-1-2 TaxID=2728841 RepID=UPI00146A8BE3|nr:sensor histidine kinase [Pseudoflavitalea sp. G-6-1-2]NML19969.1 hypothetical protein [Pseudoflavitalea sp. G-6-1-2]